MVLNVIPFVHKLLNETVSKEDVCIDATMGNGHDTLLLSKLSKKVYAFDIQEQAILSTQELLDNNNVSNVELIHDSHTKIADYVKTKVKAVTFNLGYLPGSDKSVQTNKSSTIQAINQSLELLVKGGLITIILYIGHEGGLTEANYVEEHVSTLNKSHYQVVKYDFINRDKSPYVLVIEKQ